MFDTIKGIIGDIAAGAIKDQRIALSQEQLGALDLKLRDALSENTVLRKHVAELEQVVADRDARIQQLTVANQQQRYGNRMEIEEQILLFLAQHARCTESAITQHLSIGDEKVRFHLQELERDGLIFGAHDQEGRRYLNDRNLL
jgi:hypothetical protein